MSTELRIRPSGHIHKWGPVWLVSGSRYRSATCGRTYPDRMLTWLFPSGGRRCSRCFPVEGS